MTKSLSKFALLAGVTMSGFAATAAHAADMNGDWLSKDRFQVRARMIDILADGNGVVSGTTLGTDVNNAVVPEIDLTYFLTKNVSAELIAATAQHKVKAGGLDLGDTWILPPTLTLQYHFMPDEKFNPYVGAGLNYSMFYGEDSGTGFNNLDVKGGLGYAVQAGFDYWLNDHWGLNVDAKYVKLNVDVNVNQGTTALHANGVDLDPLIIGAGVSYRF